MARLRTPVSVFAIGLAVLVTAGCTGDPTPAPSASAPTVSPSPESSSPAPAEPAPAPTEQAPAPAPAPAPPAAALGAGEPCDPAAGYADCTDIGSTDGTWRIVVGYDDCTRKYPGEEDGMCVDLDGDGHWGYPESH